MGQVIVSIGGRNYPLSCRDGDEGRIAELANGIAAKAEGLTRSLGGMSEPRLLLMSALMIADELHELRHGKAEAWAAPRPVDPATLASFEALAERAERLADRLAG